MRFARLGYLGVASVALSLFFLPSIASGGIYYDFSGTCEVDCERLGIPEGTDFFFGDALDLAEGTDTSPGIRNVTIETFVAFDIDFTPSVLSRMGFLADGAIDFFAAGGLADGNRFCFNLTGASCQDGRFDTIVFGHDGVAEGAMGHGSAFFTGGVTAAVPEPVTPALLGLGLLGFGIGGRARRPVR